MKNEKYKKGYVAFVDILGFKNAINKDSVETFKKIFDIFDNLKSKFNAIEKIDIKMLFGSDSVFITTEEGSFSHFALVLRLLASVVYKELGLLLRGGITYGDYYHDNSNVFGPAVCMAVELEGQAKYSRIIFQDEVVKRECLYNDDLAEVFVDFDGKYCLNLYAYSLWDNLEYPIDISKYDENQLFEILLANLSNIKKTITSMCINHIYTPNVEKYLWQIVPYNALCNLIIEDIERIDYIGELKKSLTEKEIKEIRKLKITDILSER